MLGAVAHATSRVDLMTYVTCPTMRYHPAVVAQKPATLQLLSEGRFTLGLGSGENLNEHVVGDGWPGVETRHEMLAEAVEIIRALHGDWSPTGATTSTSTPRGSGTCRTSRSSSRWRSRATGPSSGFAPLADHLVAVEPDAGLIESWNAVEGARRIEPSGAKAIGQVPICWDPDEKTAVTRAHEQFRWFAGGWSVNADLPTRGVRGGEPVRAARRRGRVHPVRPDLDRIVEAVGSFWEAGFTDVALVQVGATRRTRSSRRPPDRCWRSCARGRALTLLGRVPDGLPAACATCGR